MSSGTTTLSALSRRASVLECSSTISVSPAKSGPIRAALTHGRSAAAVEWHVNILGSGMSDWYDVDYVPTDTARAHRPLSQPRMPLLLKLLAKTAAAPIRLT